MRKIEKVMLYACAFAVIISALFYAFAKISGITEPKIGVFQFFTIVMFGIMISVVNMIFEVKSLHAVLKLLIHYATLLLSFSIVFIANGNIGSEGGAAIFSAVIIFTFFYAVLFLIVWLIRRGISKLDDKLGKKSSANQPKNNTYNPRFK